MAKGRRRQPKGGKGGKGSGKPKTGQAWLGEATAVVWTTDQHPASSGGATVDAVAELIAVEMGDIFAGQGAWSERGRLVSQGTHAMQFDVGLETIQQWQDQGTNAGLGETGGVVWDSAIILSRLLATHAAALGLPLGADTRWLELGSGCGGVGIAVSKVLHVPVVLSDQESILPILAKNVRGNRCSSFTTQVAHLEWGAGATCSLAPDTPPFDVIFGADVLFNEELVMALVETLVERSCKATTVVIAVEAREPTVLEMFLSAAVEAFGECRRLTLDLGTFTSAFPPQGAEAEAARKAWAGSPMLVYVLRFPRRHAGGGSSDASSSTQPEPSVAVLLDSDEPIWREIETLLKSVPKQLQSGHNIRQQLLDMAPAERTLAVGRLRDTVARNEVVRERRKEKRAAEKARRLVERQEIVAAKKAERRAELEAEGIEYISSGDEDSVSEDERDLQVVAAEEEEGGENGEEARSHFVGTRQALKPQ